LAGLTVILTDGVCSGLMMMVSVLETVVGKAQAAVLVMSTVSTSPAAGV